MDGQGQRSAVSGQRSAVSGQRSAVSGQRSAVSAVIGAVRLPRDGVVTPALQHRCKRVRPPAGRDEQ
ncbi:hypothetical protein E4K10_18620 [Streptomyces sp. T1317-0309]|nr:hypothetical protein E4K10_18620 [Streptomyces sp. T1317-0309]